MALTWPSCLSLDNGDFHVLDLDTNQEEVYFSHNNIFQVVPVRNSGLRRVSIPCLLFWRILGTVYWFRVPGILGDIQLLLEKIVFHIKLICFFQTINSLTNAVYSEIAKYFEKVYALQIINYKDEKKRNHNYNQDKALLAKRLSHTYFDLLYSNSMWRQSSMPTSILIELFISGYDERVWTNRSISRTMSDNLLTIVTLRKYLEPER